MSTQGFAVLRHGDSGARERMEAAAQGSWIALLTAERNAEKRKQPLDIRCVRWIVRYFERCMHSADGMTKEWRKTSGAGGYIRRPSPQRSQT